MQVARTRALAHFSNDGLLQQKVVNENPDRESEDGCLYLRGRHLGLREEVGVGASPWASVLVPEMGIASPAPGAGPAALSSYQLLVDADASEESERVLRWTIMHCPACRDRLLIFLPAPHSYCLIHTLMPEGLWVLISIPGRFSYLCKYPVSSESYSILTLSILQQSSMQENLDNVITNKNFVY